MSVFHLTDPEYLPRSDIFVNTITADTADIKHIFIDNIDVTGDVNIGGDLGVSGASEVKYLYVGSTGIFNSNIGVSGACLLSSTLSVGATATFNSNIGVSGTVSCAKLLASSAIGSTASPVPQIYLSNGGTGVTGLNHYQQTHVVTTYSGAYASPIPATYNLTRVGNLVSLCLGATAGTVSGTPVSIGIDTNVPSAYYPTDYVRQPIVIRNNGSDIVGRFECSPVGAMFMSIGTTGISNVGLASVAPVTWQTA